MATSGGNDGIPLAVGCIDDAPQLNAAIPLSPDHDPMDGLPNAQACAFPPKTIIFIRTSDGHLLHAYMYPLVKHSPVIRELLYAYCRNPEQTDPVLHLNPGFDGATLKKVLEWCHHHEDMDASKPLEPSDVCQWDHDYLKMDMKSLLEVVKASYYLEIEALGDLTCRGLADRMEGKSTDELREMFDDELISSLSAFPSSSDDASSLAAYSASASASTGNSNGTRSSESDDAVSSESHQPTTTSSTETTESSESSSSSSTTSGMDSGVRDEDQATTAEDDDD